MITPRALVSGIAAAVALAACVVDEPPPAPLAEGDLGVFVAAAQPVLDARCADQTCHGHADRPLALYSPGRRRADPARTFLDEPLTAAEVVANARAVAAFGHGLSSEELDDCLVLRKPLALAAGGAGHAGGAQFAGRDERDYQALRAFLATVMSPEEP